MCSAVHAQSYRYIDESGNIHFVDSFQQVPPRYRTQLEGYVPTPAVTPAKKSGKSAEARQREVDRERERLERERKKEEAKRKKLFEKEIKKNQKLKKELGVKPNRDPGVLAQFTPIPQPVPEGQPSYELPAQSQEP